MIFFTRNERGMIHTRSLAHADAAEIPHIGRRRKANGNKIPGKTTPTKKMVHVPETKRVNVGNKEARKMSDDTKMCVCALATVHTRARFGKKKKSLVQHWIAPSLQRRRWKR